MSHSNNDDDDDYVHCCVVVFWDKEMKLKPTKKNVLSRFVSFIWRL